jgi:CheY-like chemotaxis protein
MPLRPDERAAAIGVPRAAEARAVEVLIVEDNPADVRLAKEAWRELGVPHCIRVATNGEEALEVLRCEGVHEGSPRPQLVVLDLNLPRMDGRELLERMKRDPELGRIPVVVLTTSDRDLDIRTSYQLQANCYVVKPVGLEPALRVMKEIASFWFTVAALP